MGHVERVSEKLFHKRKAFYRDVKACVKINREVSASFRVCRGVM